MGCTGLSGGIDAKMEGDRGRSKVLTSCVHRRRPWCPERPVLVPMLVCGSYCEASLLSGQGGPCKGRETHSGPQPRHQATESALFLDCGINNSIGSFFKRKQDFTSFFIHFYDFKMPTK